MEYFDVLGYIVPALVAISLVAKDVVTMRVLNLVACVVCLLCGLMIGEPTVVAISTLVASATAYSVMKAYRVKQMRQRAVTSRLEIA